MSIVGVEVLDDVTRGDSCKSCCAVFEGGNVGFLGGIEYLPFQGGSMGLYNLKVALSLL